MKIKNFTFFLLFCLGINAVSAQNLQLFHNENEVSNTEINIKEITSDGEVKVVINIKNNSSNAIEVKVRKNVREDIDGAENTFCLGSCFDPSVTESPTSITIEAGETTGSDDFYVLYLPHGNVGNAEIIYEVFNIEDEDDNVTVTVNFSFISYSLMLFYNDIEVSNGEININETTSDDEIKVVINIKNNSEETINVKVRKNVRDDIEGAENTFCLGSCFDPTVTESPTSLTIEAGETTGSDDFYVLFLPHGNTGEAQIIFDVYNEEFTDDMVTVTVNFTITPTSINILKKEVSISAFPNPAFGTSLFINYNLPQLEKVFISIYNILGVQIFNESIINTSGKIEVDINSLPKGIYLYSLESNGRKLITKKLIIAR